MKLTHNNYFTEDNKYLSNSKVSDWLKCKDYFKKKHIDHTIYQPVTDPMIIGSAVDTWLTEGRAKFNKQYTTVSRRSRKSDTPWRYQLTPTMYDSIGNMCTKAMKSPAIKYLKKEKFISQEILHHDMDLGEHFAGIAGIPDWYKIDNKVAIVIDLKTSQTIDPTKYHYKCLDLGYYRQQAMYQMLLKSKNKDVSDYISYHIVIEKDTDGINKVQTFELDQDRIEQEKVNLLEVFDSIGAEKKFLPHQATLKNSILIGSYYE